METAALRAALPPGTPIVGFFANGALCAVLVSPQGRSSVPRIVTSVSSCRGRCCIRETEGPSCQVVLCCEPVSAVTHAVSAGISISDQACGAKLGAG